jgi:hypothetical protein
MTDVRYEQSSAVKRGFCLALLDGKMVWFGLQSKMPINRDFDEIFMHPEDIFDMEDKAEKAEYEARRTAP